MKKWYLTNEGQDYECVLLSLAGSAKVGTYQTINGNTIHFQFLKNEDFSRAKDGYKQTGWCKLPGGAEKVRCSILFEDRDNPLGKLKRADSGRYSIGDVVKRRKYLRVTPVDAEGKDLIVLELIPNSRFKFTTNGEFTIFSAPGLKNGSIRVKETLTEIMDQMDNLKKK